MARRRVEVDLILNARNYLDEDKRVLVATKAAEVAVAELGDETDDLSHDMAQLAANTDVAKRQVDDFGDEARGSARDLEFFENRVDASTKAVLALAAALQVASLAEAAPGGGGGAPPVPGARGGGRAFHGSLHSQAIAGVVALIAAAAPGLGAIIAGAVVGTVAGGGIIGGIVAAAHDPRVKAAWTDFTSTLTAKSFGSEAFAEPTVRGIEILKDGLADLHLADVLGQGAPAVETLAEGVVRFAKGVLPGLDAAMRTSDRSAHIMADGFADVGSAFGEMIRDFTQKEGTFEGLALLFRVLTDAIKVTHATLGFLTDSFHALLGPSYSAAKSLQAIYFWLPPLANFFGRNADEIQNMRTGTEGLVPRLTRLSDETIAANQSLDPFVRYLIQAQARLAQLRGELVATRQALVEYWRTLRAQNDANLAWEQALDDLTESVRENGRTLDIHTQAGRNNIRAVEDGIDAAQRQYEQGLITSQQYEEQIQKLIMIGVQAGLSRQALEQLAGPYRIQIMVDLGVSIAKGVSDFVAKALNHVFGGATTGPVNMGRPMGEQRAGGGPLRPGVPYIFGENGPEIGMFGQSGYMYSNAQSAAIAEQWQSAPGVTDFNPAAMAAALATALSGAQVVMDGQVVGQLVTAQQDSGLYAGHRV